MEGRENIGSHIGVGVVRVDFLGEIERNRGFREICGKGKRSMYGIREEDFIKGDVRRDGSRREGVEDVGRGYGVSLRSGDVGSAGESEEVVSGRVVGGEGKGEKERVVGGSGGRRDSE